MYEFRPELVAKFPSQFEACLALSTWTADHRPSSFDASSPANELILVTYARSTKTYLASVMLAGFGYGAQAGMLNRSLFEDMAVAHWVKLNPEEAPSRYERHRQHTMAQMKAAYAKHGRAEEFASWPPLQDSEREELADEYDRKHHWTKLSLFQLVKAIEGEFTDANIDRRMLWQVFDINHSFNNLVLHHSFFGLGLAATRAPGVITLDVGPSESHIFGALQGAFFSYGHMVSLLHRRSELDELNALWSEHIQAFSHVCQKLAAP